jgi:cytochrome c553
MPRRMSGWVGLCAVAVVVWCALVASPAWAASAPGGATSAKSAAARADLQAVLAASPDLQQGAKLFRICTECHGAHGGGDASGWPPQIAGQHRRVIAKELIDFRSGLRWYDPMARIAGRHVLHTTSDIADVAAYVSTLPPSPDTALGKGEWLEQGQRVYARRCASCHGAQGEGDDQRFVPRVAGQQFEYLLRQLHDAVEGRRPNMRAQHRRLLESADMEDLVGLAGYMSRLAGPAGT